MQMEIGSIFELDIADLFRVGNNRFYLPFMDNGDFSYVKFFNTGRSAIEYLFKYVIGKRDRRKILIPSFICSSVVDAVVRAGWEYSYYSVTSELNISVDSLKEELDEDVACVFVVHYFGKYQDDESYKYLASLKSRNICIVEDITHSVYSYHPTNIGFGDYVLGSLRKWLPIPDGAFLSSRRVIPNYEIEHGYNAYSFNYVIAQIMKSVYLRNKQLDKQAFLAKYALSTKALFSDYTIRDITDLSRGYLQSYSFKPIIEKRIENYDYLWKNLSQLRYAKPLFKRSDGQVPFGYVVLSVYRDRLLEYLISRGVYCNVHWRIPEAIIDPIARDLSRRILTIPCDQRYGKTEMDYIIRVLNGFAE